MRPDAAGSPPPDTIAIRQDPDVAASMDLAPGVSSHRPLGI